MEYLEFQGGLKCVDDDGEGITLRFIPEVNDSIGMEKPIYRIYIDQPEDAEEVGKKLVNYSENYEVESVGIENNKKVEVYFFDIESPVVICGSSVEILKTSLEAEDYESYILNLRHLVNEYAKESAGLYEKVNSASNLISEIERRWKIKLEGHALSSNEAKLYNKFVTSLNRIQHKLST